MVHEVSNLLQIKNILIVPYIVYVKELGHGWVITSVLRGRIYLPRS